MKHVFCFLLFTFFLSVDVQAQICNCRENVAFVVEKVEANYAGFQDKITSVNKAAYEKRKTRLKHQAKRVKDPLKCAELITAWLQTFQDGHLYLSAHAWKTHQPAAKSSERPSLQRLNAQQTLLVLPSFELRYASAIDSLVASYLQDATPQLLIDIRGNRGGGDRAYAALLPLLYTQPYEVHGVAFLASNDNRAAFEALLQEDLPASTRKLVEELVAKLKANPGQFVPWGETKSLVTFETVTDLPMRVAVIQDNRCASAAEQFLLYALQSGKTTTFGISNSKGALDYANVNDMPLPSMPYAVCMASSRSTRLPEVSVDKHGIAPQVVIPQGTQDLVGFARKHLSAL